MTNNKPTFDTVPTQGTDTCVTCEEQFGSNRPCWDSFASNEDGTFTGGVCLFCAAKDGSVSAIRELAAY